jgi:hypothetical protein
LAAALESFGFPLFDGEERELLPGERWVTWKGDFDSLMRNDDLAGPVKDHIQKYANPDYRLPEPVVRVRRAER